MKEFYLRENEQVQLSDFVNSSGPGYTHLRGRRRIGKSELLKRLCKDHDKSLYFYGSEDEITPSCINRFIAAIKEVFPESTLTDLKRSARTWDRVLKELGEEASTYDGKVIIALDEVQWIAKQRSGFVGTLKHHWSEWKKSTQVKLILCGSSNKFFERNTDGEFNTLRGLKTHADIWVHPFSLSEVKNSFFKERAWTEEQIALLYMMIGGVPYYLEQVGDDENYYRAVNEAIFTSKTIFLDEVKAILKLEFNNKSLSNVLNILSSLGQDGTTITKVSKVTGIHKQTVSDIVSKLCDYDLLFGKYPIGMKRKADNTDVLYYMKDFYLNLYFKVLSPLEKRIRSNQKGMIFSNETIQSESGHYIEDFSGKAFELLIRHILETSAKQNENIFDILKLRGLSFDVGTYWIPKKVQIDLIAESSDDRESRIIEVKWINKPLTASKIQEEILKKEYNGPSGFRKTYFLVSNKVSSTEMDKVKPITLEDLF